MPFKFRAASNRTEVVTLPAANQVFPDLIATKPHLADRIDNELFFSAHVRLFVQMSGELSVHRLTLFDQLIENRYDGVDPLFACRAVQLG